MRMVSQSLILESPESLRGSICIDIRHTHTPDSMALQGLIFHFSFPLGFSHGGPKSQENVKRTSKEALSSLTHPSLLSAHAGIYIGVRGSHEWDISSLPAFGPGGGQISRVVHISVRAPFGVFGEK